MRACVKKSNMIETWQNMKMYYKQNQLPITHSCSCTNISLTFTCAVNLYFNAMLCLSLHQQDGDILINHSGLFKGGQFKREDENFTTFWYHTLCILSARNVFSIV